MMVGNGILNLVIRALPEEHRTPEYVEAAKLDFLAYYTENIDRHSRPYDGICEVLNALSREGYTLAVASNKFDEGAKRLVAKIFPDIPFKVVYGNREGFPLKPDATLVDLIMEECGAVRETTIMVGDSGVDIQTAKGAGVRSVGCSWGFRSREELTLSGADSIIDRPSELLGVLLG